MFSNDDKNDLLWYRFITIAAYIWLLTNMNLWMSFKTTIPLESFVTLIAFIWFLPSVCSQMISKIFFVRKVYYNHCIYMASTQYASLVVIEVYYFVRKMYPILYISMVSLKCANSNVFSSQLSLGMLCHTCNRFSELNYLWKFIDT